MIVKMPMDKGKLFEEQPRKGCPLRTWLAWGGIVLCSFVLSFIVYHMFILSMEATRDTTSQSDSMENESIMRADENSERGNSHSVGASISESDTMNDLADLAFIGLVETMQIKSMTGCYTKSHEPRIIQHGKYRVLTNYIRADHGPIKCSESVTYVTHGDYTMLNDLIPVLERWKAPMSIALYAPGSDFKVTMESILYLRNCLPKSFLVRQLVTFHIYFDSEHHPNLPINVSYVCSLPPPYVVLTHDNLYRVKHSLSYPINVGRNVAREAALTHFVFVSDIDTYPSTGIPKKFLDMIARNDKIPNTKVYAMPTFKIGKNDSVPLTKTELQHMYETGNTIIHKKMPKFNEWMKATVSNSIDVFYIARKPEIFYSGLTYIGTNVEPLYEEQLMYGGGYDRIPQDYALCALDYELHILDNAFLIQRTDEMKLDDIEKHDKAESQKLIKAIIIPELEALYGKRDECYAI